jgi:iron complex outermembrane receptor protein
MKTDSIMKIGVALAALAVAHPVLANGAAAPEDADTSSDSIVVTARAGTKTETPPIQVPQPASVTRLFCRKARSASATPSAMPRG